jgi:hypothetical protein
MLFIFGSVLQFTGVAADHPFMAVNKWQKV